MIYRLVYHSQSRISGSSAEVFRSILGIVKASRRNNARVGVTGALMFYDGAFSQVLEGDQAPVKEVFGWIRADQRHDRLSLLSFATTTERAFAKSAMAVIGTSEQDRERCNVVLAGKSYDPALMTTNELILTLQRLVDDSGGGDAPSAPMARPLMRAVGH
jgi:hypothetical protein